VRCKVPVLLIAVCAGCASTGASDGAQQSEVSALSDYTDMLAWSDQPPGLSAVDVPQFVAVTFDDNFVSGLTDVTGGVTWATDFFTPLLNPAGSAIAGTFDGAPVRTTFFNNCLYLEDSNTRQSWTTAFEAGHEIANHTINHSHGAAFSVQNWTDEIAPCTAALTGAEGGVGASVDDIHGFRSPFLEYNENLFAALTGQGLEYDSSVQSCWGDAEDGTNCAWPYTLDGGSPDGVVLSAKFATPALPAAPGLWELSTSALFVPPDELAAQYGISAGLRGRIPSDMPAPSLYEPSTGRIAPLDVTLFVDAGMSADEVLATLKYTLDRRLSGNRAPFVFVAHTHVYASNYGAAANAPDASERQRVIEEFVTYALSQSSVRMRPLTDVLSWMRTPVPLGGVITMPVEDGGAPSGGNAGTSSAGAAGSAGSAPGAGTGGGGSGGSAAGAAGSAVTGPTPASPLSPSGCSCGLVSRKTPSAALSFAALGLLFVAGRRRARATAS
jgi:hypothetical protein